MTRYEQNKDSHKFLALDGVDLINHLENLGPEDTEVLLVFMKAIHSGTLDTHTDVWLSEIFVRTEKDCGIEYRHNGLGAKILREYEEEFRQKGRRRVVGLMQSEKGYDKELEKWYVDKMKYTVRQVGSYKFVYKDLQK